MAEVSVKDPGIPTENCFLGVCITVWGLIQISAVPGKELKEEGIGSWKGAQTGKDENSAGSAGVGLMCPTVHTRKAVWALPGLASQRCPCWPHEGEKPALWAVGVAHRGYEKEQKVK